MKKIVLSIFSILLLFVVSASFTTDHEIEASIHYVHAIYGETYQPHEMLEAFDYAFIARIDNFLYTVDGGQDYFEVPLSFFEVTDIYTLKGELRNIEVIKFFGGYDLSGQLIILDDMIYPVIGNYYLFFSDEPSYDDLETNIPGNFTISMAGTMELIEGYVPGYDIQYQNDEIQDFIDLYLFDHSYFMMAPISSHTPDGGAGAPENTTLETATWVSPNTNYQVTVGPNENRYFKFKHNDFDVFHFYSTNSTQGFDPVIVTYSEFSPNTALIHGINYSVSGAPIDSSYSGQFTTDPNFFLSFYLRKDVTYYFKITGEVTNTSGTTTFRFFKDNVLLGLYHEYLLPGNSVPPDRKIFYKNDSVYSSHVETAVNLWDELGLIRFYPQASGWFTRRDLLIRDISNSSAPNVLGTYNWTTNVISLNRPAIDARSTGINHAAPSVILHELGHALGLHHMPMGNVMHEFFHYRTNFGPTEIAVYRIRWS